MLLPWKVNLFISFHTIHSVGISFIYVYCLFSLINTDRQCSSLRGRKENFFQKVTSNTCSTVKLSRERVIAVISASAKVQNHNHGLLKNPAWLLVHGDKRSWGRRPANFHTKLIVVAGTILRVVYVINSFTPQNDSKQYYYDCSWFRNEVTKVQKD